LFPYKSWKDFEKKSVVASMPAPSSTRFLLIVKLELSTYLDKQQQRQQQQQQQQFVERPESMPAPSSTGFSLIGS
jgi:hypothetical protein